MRKSAEELRKSGFGPSGKLKDLLPSGAVSLGQCYPQHCPQEDRAEPVLPMEPLGAPLSIQEAAALIGCSVWTVRQHHLSAGLPHVRIGPNGKLIFYESQVIRWLLRQQEKGGII